MSSKATDNLLAIALAAMKDELDGGFAYAFTGPVPDDAADALDMVDEHTECFKLSLDGDGITGLEFEPPTGSIMVKPSGAVWRGLVAFDGAEDGETELAPTFLRICEPGDDGRAAAGTNRRLQYTLGGPYSTANLKLGTDTVVANGINTQELNTVFVDFAALG